jgi:hypothetical protein
MVPRKGENAPVPRTIAGPTEGRVRIKIITSLDIGLPDLGEDGSLEVPDGASVETVVNAFVMDPELKRYLPIAVNDRLVERAHQLREGDELTVWLPASGG